MGFGVTRKKLKKSAKYLAGPVIGAFCMAQSCVPSGPIPEEELIDQAVAAASYRSPCGDADLVQMDSDGDGLDDCEDLCPADADKIEPGQCGCGAPDTDSDGDLVPDCDDDCPGTADVDVDGDGITDCDDPCTFSADADGDGVADCEDECPGSPDADSDGDGRVDCLDLCPEDPARTQPGAEGCGAASVTESIKAAQAAKGTGSAPMSSANRASGSAPLAVFFDAVDAKSGVVQPAGGKYGELFYRWDFGDEVLGRWSNTGQPKNEATGYVAAHVYDRPGLYTVTLHVTDGSGKTNAYHQTINVSGFPADTIYVSNSGGADANSGATPTKPLKSLEKALSLQRPGRRILLKRGDTWTVGKSLSIEADGPAWLGAYAGTNGLDDPRLARPRIVYNNSGDLFRIGNARDWRISDLDLASTSGTSGSAVAAFRTMHQVLFLRLQITSFKSGFNYSVGQSAHDGNFIVDTDVRQSREKSAYIGGNRSALLGSRFIGAGSHVLRVWHSRKFVIGENELLDPKAKGNASLKLHNQPGLSPATEYVIVAGNSFRGDQWPVTLGPQNTKFVELVRQVVFERNWVTIGGDERGKRGVCVFGPDITVRNNVFDGTRADASPYVAVDIEPRGDNGPIPHRAAVYHNTVYRTDGTAALCQIHSDTAGAIVANNLLTVQPAALAKSRLIFGSAVTAGNHTLAVTNLFEDPSDGDFLPRAGTLVLDSGDALAGVGEDFVGELRPAGGEVDAGAFERP